MKRILTILLVGWSSIMCAASIDWTFNGEIPSTQTVTEGNKAVLFASIASNGDIYSTLFSALKSNDSSVLSSYTVATVTVVNHPLFGPVVAEAGTFGNIRTDVGAAGNYNFYVAIFNADAPADGDYFVLTDAKNADTSSDTMLTTVVFDSVSMDGWTLIGDGGVPEPTVLALLALGVAGLALKRKVA